MNYDYDLCKLCYYACSVCMSFHIYIRVHHFISVVSHNLSPANYCKRAYRLRRTSQKLSARRCLGAGSKEALVILARSECSRPPFAISESCKRYLCKIKRANSDIGALFRGGLLRVVTRYCARLGRVITRLSVNQYAPPSIYTLERCSAQTWVCQYAVMR